MSRLLLVLLLLACVDPPALEECFGGSVNGVYEGSSWALGEDTNEPHGVAVEVFELELDGSRIFIDLPAPQVVDRDTGAGTVCTIWFYTVGDGRLELSVCGFVLPKQLKLDTRASTYERGVLLHEYRYHIEANQRDPDCP